MKIARGYSLIILAILLLTCTQIQVESGPVTACLCFGGCKIAFGACTGCGVFAASVTLGAAAPVATFGIYGCLFGYTGCMTACTASGFIPIP